MHFLNPLALWGLLSLPAILAMYLLKQKYKELPVPSLFLWTAAIEHSDAERPWQRLRRNALMLLQLLAALLLTLALARPAITAHGQASETIIILDCSLSMQATDASPSRFEQARAEAKRIADRLGPQGKAALIVLSAEPYIAEGFTSDKAALLARIQSLAPTNRAADMPAAMALAAALAEQGNPEIILLTDSAEPFAVANSAVSRFLVGETADNTAILRVSHRQDGEQLVCLVQLKSFCAAETTATVALYTDDKLFDMVEVALAPDAEEDIYFTNLPPGTQTLTARLTNPDALLADNTAWDCVYPASARRTILFTERNVFLENMLAILPNVELYTGKTENMETTSGYYLYVYDGVLPQVLPEDGHILIFNPPEGNTVLETGASVNVSSAALTLHSTEYFGENTDFAVRTAKQIAVPDWAEVALSADGVPLALTGQLDGRRIAVLAFDLHETDLPLRKEFPIFMYNLCRQFMPAETLAAQALTVGTPIFLQADPDATDMHVTLPNDTRVPLAPPFPAPPLTQTNAPGIYTVSQTREGIASQTYFALNLAPDTDSDLRRDMPAGYTRATTALADAPQAAGHRDITVYILAGLLLCLLAEWRLYSRR